ncbi:hypothetical protein WJX84_004098 [Apatococcus fuscideae]|uniref:MHD1 domain-containing protein n=1 Tax=Apatococcus fuscideae TaxID=2026836 RepID=A0AAW1SRJ2_9CHLO
MAPLLFHWVQSQLAQLGAWTSRILESESWQPISPSRLLSRSAIEIVKIATETIEGLFGMQLPLPVDLVRCLTEGIDAVLQRYAKAVQEQVGSPDVYIPPPPALTRYKKDLAAKAEASETSPKVTPKNRSAVPSTPSGHDHEGSDLAEERAAALSAESLLVRLNSLHYLGAGLPDMEGVVRDRWEEAVSGAAGSSSELDSGHWLHGVFEGADVTISQSCGWRFTRSCFPVSLVGAAKASPG